jgi:hypothetical protein
VASDAGSTRRFGRVLDRLSVWEIRLDEDDPLGAHSAMRRAYFKEEVRNLNSLFSADPFNRMWVDSDGKVIARAEAWGRELKHQEDGSQTGEGLVCTSDFLLRVLAQKQTSLVMLINAQHYNESVLESRHGLGSFLSTKA